MYVGYHGCSEKHGEEYLRLGARKKIHISEADYEWLGKGFYIWENNYTRAYEWRAKEYKTTEKPFVIGVIYSLDECLDLTDSKYLDLVSQAYASLKSAFDTAHKPLPINQKFDNQKSGFRGKRLLDFAVLEELHSTMDNSYSEKSSILGFARTEKSSSLLTLYALLFMKANPFTRVRRSRRKITFKSVSETSTALRDFSVR